MSMLLLRRRSKPHKFALRNPKMEVLVALGGPPGRFRSQTVDLLATEPDQEGSQKKGRQDSRFLTRPILGEFWLGKPPADGDLLGRGGGS